MAPLPARRPSPGGRDIFIPEPPGPLFKRPGSGGTNQSAVALRRSPCRPRSGRRRPWRADGPTGGDPRVQHDGGAPGPGREEPPCPRCVWGARGTGAETGPRPVPLEGRSMHPSWPQPTPAGRPHNVGSSPGPQVSPPELHGALVHAPVRASFPFVRVDGDEAQGPPLPPASTLRGTDRSPLSFRSTVLGA